VSHLFIAEIREGLYGETCREECVALVGVISVLVTRPLKPVGLSPRASVCID